MKWEYVYIKWPVLAQNMAHWNDFVKNVMSHQIP